MAFLLLIIFMHQVGVPLSARDSGVTVSLLPSSLLVVEGNTFTVCVLAIATPESPQEFVIEVEPALKFITAVDPTWTTSNTLYAYSYPDRGDVFPVDQIHPVVLTNNMSVGCIDFWTLQNDDGYRFSETFALTIMNSSSYTALVDRSRTDITLIEATLMNVTIVPSIVSVSEGNSAVICIAAEFKSSTGRLVLGLAIQDLSTSSDDYSRDAIPDNVILSQTQSIKCLRIPVFINEDGHNSTESFQITFSYKLAAPGFEQLDLSSVLVTLHEQCLDGEIRLVKGSVQGGGVIEICRDGVFGTVCSSNWTVDDSNKVCRQLGYISKEDAIHYYLSKGELDCSVYDVSLSNCNENLIVNNCSQGRSVQIYCLPDCLSKTCPTVCRLDEFECPSEERCLQLSHICDGIPDCITTTGDIPDEEECSPLGCPEGEVFPLLGGASSLQGFVQICVGGNYHPVSMSTFTVEEAAVVCRTMGLGSAGFPLSATEDLGLDLNQFLKLQEYLAAVQCNGVEKSLSRCVIETALFNNITDLAAVQCTEAVQCSDGDFRLMSASGISSTEGRVEVCFLGVWGAIFDPNWTALEASIMCKELQQNPKGALPFISATYSNDAQFIPVIYDSPACDSDSYGSVLECPRAAKLCAHNNESGNLPLFYGNGAGSVSGDLSAPSEELVGFLGRLTDKGRRAGIGYVGVKCETYPHSGCNESNVRLTHRDRSQASGNLEICFNNTWAIVCSELFDENILNVTCRALGFTYFEGMEKHKFIGASMNVSGPMLWQRLTCTGSESSLGECSSSPTSNITCTNVWIQCLARPRIYVSPQPRDGTFSVEQNRRAKLERLVDQDSYPPITSLRNPVSSVADKKRSLLNVVPLCSSVSLYETEAAQVNDSGNYSCGDNRGASVGVEIKVKTPDAMDVSIAHYLRLSTISSQRLSSFYGVANTTAFIEHIVLHSIPSNSAGLQTVQCYKVARRRLDERRSLTRLECLVINFLSPSVREPSSLLGRASALLKRLYPATVLSVKISGSGFCDFDRMEYEGSIYLWPELRVGATSYWPCPDDRTANKVTRQCLAGGVWTQPDASVCIVASRVLDDILSEGVTEDRVEMQTSMVEKALEVTVNDTIQQTADVLDSVSSFFAETATLALKFSNTTLSPSVVGSLVRGFGSLQQWKSSVIRDNPEVSNSIVLSFEAISTQFADQLPASTNFSQVVPNQVVFIAENAPVTSLQRSGRLYSVSNKNEGNFSSRKVFSHSGQVASIYLPANIFQDISSRMDIGLVFSVYNDNTFFPLRQAAVSDANTSRRLTVASSVLAATVGLDMEFKDLNPPVEFTMALSIGDIETVNGSEKCVFWDFEAARGKGNWSSDGCIAVSSVNGLVTCRCTHLTNFAILVDICSRLEDCEEPDPDITKALGFITHIGVALSMIGLAITIITLISFNRLWNHDASKFHIQLSIAIFMMLLVFVAGVEQSTEYIPCLVVSILLHYFTLASVMWMGAEAILMFHKFIFVFKYITTKYIVVMSCICWLSPLPLVLTPLIVDLAGGNDPSGDLIISRGKVCFLSNIVVFWVSFLGPLLIVVLFNIVLFVVVIVVLIKHLRSASLRRNESIQRKVIFRFMLSIIGVMFLFGLSWIFAAFTITIQAIQLPAQVLFTIFSSTQGFGNFIFFCVLNHEARESWKELLSCGRYKSKFLHPSKFLSGSSGHRLHATGTGSTDIFSKRSLNALKLTPLRQPVSARTNPTSITNSIENLEETTTTDLQASSETHPTTKEQWTGKSKPLKPRIMRKSTMRESHEVEEYQVDFNDSSCSEQEGFDS